MDTLLNIVVVEDHHALREVTVEALRGQGHHVVGLECAEELPEVSDLSIDLMVIDLNLPGEDGISLVRRIRHGQPNIGIIMLTARTMTSDRLTGYQSGADIYLTKPTSLEELSSAIQAVARRIKPSPAEAVELQFEVSLLTLTGSQKSVSLTKQESALLVAFTRAVEQKLEHWQLIQLLDTAEKEYSKANLEVVITRLRKKMLAAGGSSQHPIQSIREYGYQLCEPVKLL